MGQITLGDVGVWLAGLAALIGSCTIIFQALKKLIEKLFKAQTESIKADLDAQRDTLTRIDLEGTKNFLVNVLSAAERGEQMTEIQKIRVREQYDHYTTAGGNSYIKDWYSRLKAEGKL